MESSSSNLPLRIELATSELEGGEYLSWADPEQVLACVAQVRPRGAFARFLEPRLADLESPLGGGGIGAAGSGELPSRLKALLQRVRQAHGRLYRERASEEGAAVTLRPIFGLVEDRRVYFVRAIPSWVFRLRGAGCELITPGGETEEAPGGLGSSEKLSLSVTSLDVEPDDVIVFLASNAAHAPDPRAVAQAFGQHQDLKRACDGIVNLFAFHSTGVGAVALRFVPIGTPGAQGAPHIGESLLLDLERELASAGDRVQAVTAAQDRAQGGDAAGAAPPEVPLPDLLNTLEPAGAPTSTHPAPRELPSPVPQEVASEAPRGASSPSRRGEVRRWLRKPWLSIVCIGAVAALATTAALPRWIPVAFGGGRGAVRIESDPPAQRVLLDGADMETGTPALLPGVKAGSHRVELDYGPFGREGLNIRVRPGKETLVTHVARGGIDLTVTAPRPDAMAWTGSHERAAPPCRFDSLPIGWQTIAYEDGRLPFWQRQVLVRAGEVARVRVNNSFAQDRALLRVESWAMHAGSGLRESTGDSVLVDGRLVGSSPWEGEVAPGLHGVRVSRRGADPWTEIVDLQAGASNVVASRFGAGARPRILHQPPGRLVLRDPVPLTARFVAQDGSPPRNPRIHFPLLDAGVRDMPLAPVSSDPGNYVALIPAASIPLLRPTPYYFTVQTDDGATLSSELFQLEAVTHHAESMDRRPAPIAALP